MMLFQEIKRKIPPHPDLIMSHIKSQLKSVSRFLMCVISDMPQIKPKYQSVTQMTISLLFFHQNTSSYKKSLPVPEKKPFYSVKFSMANSCQELREEKSKDFSENHCFPTLDKRALYVYLSFPAFSHAGYKGIN